MCSLHVILTEDNPDRRYKLKVNPKHYILSILLMVKWDFGQEKLFLNQ